MGEEDPNRHARYQIMVPADPTDDEVQIRLDYRDVSVRAKWRDSKRADFLDLLAQAGWFIDRAHLEYEVHRQAGEIDGDLNNLFPEDTEEGE